MKMAIANLSFESKKEARTKIGQKLKKWRENNKARVDEKHEGWELLCCLVEMHPESLQLIGCGIVEFHLTKNQAGHEHIMFIREDGTEDNFSWSRGSISGKTRKNPHKYHLKQAMRFAITDLNQNCKNKAIAKLDSPSPPTCEGCGDRFKNPHDINSAHVHHASKPFDTIMNEFVARNHPTPQKFDKQPNHIHMATFRPHDIGWEAKWKVYHAKHATLTLMHKACHRDHHKRGR